MSQSESQADNGKAQAFLPTLREALLSSTFIAAVSCIAYAVTFLYEFGYAWFFRIPTSLIAPNLTTVFCVGISFLSLLWPAHFVLVQIREAKGDLPPKSTITMTIVSPFLLTLSVLLLNLSTWVVVWTLVAVFLVNLSIYLFHLLRFQYVGPPKEKMKAYQQSLREEWARWSLTHGPIPRYCLRHPVFLIGICVACLLIPLLLGDSGARRQEYFLIPSDYPDYAVLRQYGDRLICARIDTSAMAVHPEFRILPIDNAGRTLRLEKIGRLSFASIPPSSRPTTQTVP